MKKFLKLPNLSLKRPRKKKNSGENKQGHHFLAAHYRLRTHLFDYEPLRALAVERGPVDATKLVCPVDEAVHGVVPDGDGRPGLAGSRVVISVSKFNMKFRLRLG